MASHHAFGIAGSARGVHQRPRIGRHHVLLGLASAACRDKVFVGTIANWTRTLAEMNETTLSDGQILSSLLDEADKLVLNDQGPGLGVLDDELAFLPHQPEVEGEGHKSCLGWGCVNSPHRDAMVAEYGDAIALGQTKAEQGIGEPARTFVPLRESHRAVEIPGAYTIRRQPRMDREHLSKIQEILHVTLLEDANQ